MNGRPDQTRLAAQVLRSFYEQAKSGLSLEDVQLGLIEAASPRKAPAPDGSAIAVPFHSLEFDFVLAPAGSLA